MVLAFIMLSDVSVENFKASTIRAPADFRRGANNFIFSDIHKVLSQMSEDWKSLSLRHDTLNKFKVYNDLSFLYKICHNNVYQIYVPTK